MATSDHAPARARAKHWRTSVPVDAFLEIADLLFGDVLGHAVAFLDFAGQVIAIAFGYGQIVVGELAPLRLDLAVELLPFAFDDVGINEWMSSGGWEEGAGAR